jgi:hypothetical protein
MAKDGNGTFVQKLMEVHVNTSKKLTYILCIKKIENNKTKKKKKALKNREKK